MKKELYLLLSVLVAALAVRLYPTLISGLPFSVDAWPLIHNTELLYQNTPIALSNPLFDGYNNYMPAVQLYGLALSEITGLPPIVAMAIGIPVAAALAVPLFYVLTKKVTTNTTAALAAALLLATVFPYAMFMAGVTKESYASPLLFSVLLLFLFKHDLKTSCLFAIAVVALTLTHHLTAFIAVGVIACLTIASYVSKPVGQKVNSGRSNILFTVGLGCVAFAYFGFLAFPALNLTVTTSDLLSLGAYSICLTALAIYFSYTSKGFSTKKTILYGVLWTALGATIIFLITQVPLLPGAPALPMHYFLFALPTLMGLPLVMAAFKELNKRRPSLILPLFWVVAIASFGVYAVFSNPLGGFGLVYRSVNFLLPPFLILVGLGIFGLSSSMKSYKRMGKALVIGLVLCIASLNFYGVYSSVSLSEPYFGYFWRYEPSEFKSAQFVATAGGNQTIGGDAKVSYLLHGYFNKNVTILDGYKYLEGSGSASPLFFVYGQMYQNGYVLYQGIPEPLPQNWTWQLADYNQVYVNSEVTIYAK